MAERTETSVERRGTGALYGLTRATITLIAAGGAGLLIWLATQIDDTSTGGYWAAYGIIAGAGVVMALSQLLGGWTKWGWPRLSMSVFLWAFIPVAIAVLWVFLYHQPGGNWFRSHIRSWSGDIGIGGIVRDFGGYLAVLTFGLGLVFGYTFDTTGPAIPRSRTVTEPDEVPAEPTTPADREAAADAPIARDQGSVGGIPGEADRTREEQSSGRL